MTTEGWVKQHAKKEVLEEFKIPLTDLNQDPFDKGTVVLYLSRAKTERKLKSEDAANLVVTILQQNSFLSNFIPPAMHYIEDTQLPDQASMHDLKISFKRLKRVRILYLKMLATMLQTFFWIYPEFSKIVMILYCFSAVFLPAQYVLPLFFMCVLAFCALMNPKNKKILKNINSKFFSEEKHIVPYPRVLTIKESVHIKKCKITILKEKAQEGVIKRWKKFKEDAVELQNYLTLLACYGEKLRHLFLWENPQKSYYFCIGLLMFIAFLIVIPFRAVLLFGGLYRFYKGYKYTKKRILQNRKLCEEVLSSLFVQYLNDSFLRINSNEFWAKEILESSGIQKRIVEGIRMRLSLDVTLEIFEFCKSPLELCNYLSSAATMLRHKDNKGEHVYDYHADKNNNLLLGFLTNVPSEYYRLEHPRLSSVESYY